MDAEINDLQALCDAKESELYKAHCEIERLIEWIETEGERTDVCTKPVTGKICRNCRCEHHHGALRELIRENLLRWGIGEELGDE